MTGTVVRLVVKEGHPMPSFGFIRIDATQDDIFFMPSCLLATIAWDTIRQGDRVEFEVVSHPKGLRAMQVRPRGMAAVLVG